VQCSNSCCCAEAPVRDTDYGTGYANANANANANEPNAREV